MSYDIYLKDPVTGEAANVPGHLMIGGTYKADYHEKVRVRVICHGRKLLFWKSVGKARVVGV